MNFEYLMNFEAGLQNELLKICSEQGVLAGRLLENDDINGRWRELAPEYMVDAVPQVRNYPTVSVAWAAYLGMAIANGWDADWEATREVPYNSFYGKAGFDDMDENIVENILGLSLDSEASKRIEQIIRQCGEATVTYIRHEGVEPQSETAFHIFARACRVMYKIGAAIELSRLGYKYEKITLN